MSDGNICMACDKRVGTGTLLDFQPNVPPAGERSGVTQRTWQQFARSYRCPMCAGDLTDAAAAPGVER